MTWWQFLTKVSLVGNAVLLVLLTGGSHPTAQSEHIGPHKPVHLARQLTVRMDQQPYWGEIFDAQQAWDDAMKEAGEQIIINQGPPSAFTYDAILVDADEGEEIDVLLKAHNGQEATYPFIGPPPGAETHSLSAADSGVNQVMKVVVLNTSWYVVQQPGVRWRTSTHEFGHVVGLADHNEEPYAGMMDGSCPCLDWPGDFQIQNYPFEKYPDYPLLELYPDEASCVRLLFDIPGKQLCNDD